MALWRPIRVSRPPGCGKRLGMTVDTQPTTLDARELELVDAWWRAANYLSVGQIYLLDNPLLKEPLQVEHVKPRLLGHWGTTPGLNFLYAHLNRAIVDRDVQALYVTGPGHGGPGVVATAYLEGTYSELYSSVTGDHDGLRSAVPPASPVRFMDTGTRRPLPSGSNCSTQVSAIPAE